jgi:hypothetical protein
MEFEEFLKLIIGVRVDTKLLHLLVADIAIVEI